MTFRKPVTEADLLACLQEGTVQFPPLQVVESQTEETRNADNILERMDALLKLRWRDRTYRFGVELRRLWTPKVVSEAIDTVRRHLSLGEEGILGSEAGGPLYPLILVPYLVEGSRLNLCAAGVNGRHPSPH